MLQMVAWSKDLFSVKITPTSNFWKIFSLWRLSWKRLFCENVQATILKHQSVVHWKQNGLFSIATEYFTLNEPNIKIILVHPKVYCQLNIVAEIASIGFCFKICVGFMPYFEKSLKYVQFLEKRIICFFHQNWPKYVKICFMFLHRMPKPGYESAM